MNTPEPEPHTPGALELPAGVRRQLASVTHSVLVDTHTLRQVRDRFDAEQADTLGRYLARAQSPNTLRAYRTDWTAFTAWCLAEGRQALPAEAVDVAVYLAACAHTRTAEGTAWALATPTLERRAAAIAAVHGAHGLASPTRSDVVRMTLRGIRRTRAARPRRKDPVTLTTLEALLAVRPPEGFPGGVARRRDAVLLLTGFAGALRRSELAALTFDDITARTDAASGAATLVVHLGTTKTDQEGRRGHVVALPRGRHRATCPLCAFADWTDLLSALLQGGQDAVRALLERAEPPAAAAAHRCGDPLQHALADGRARPLLPTVDRHGRVGERPMSGRAVGELVKRYAARAGLDPADFGGHSLRAGFATQAALGGATDRQIMRQGRWTNPRTVHDYIRTANPLEDNAVTRLGL
ncbi:site-specific recombinase XerD [Nocardiopsis sp. Huas11]|uniref:site-specific integrase n=1 Tax=Nocardiopsis sp. Huas11 TaxID=2183912 RepID=UPI000EAD9553|nr:site-specific integrase [Nocardiopsis sp. Huas11]RKS08869.1 site-specific recombinase XerD [Nocardiopsis sp. Huas11]